MYWGWIQAHFLLEEFACNKTKEEQNLCYPQSQQSSALQDHLIN